MRVPLFVALVCSAPAGWAGETLGLEAEYTIGVIWPLTSLCRGYGCPSPLAVSVRAGYEILPVASIGLRGTGVLGPEGSGRVCGTSSCDSIAGYRAGSLAVDARLHTLGTTQLVGGIALGVGRLIRLQCGCSEQYDTHGTRLPMVEIALGVRTYVVARTVHIGVEGRYSAMFNAESAGATFFGPPVAQTGLTVSAIAASFVMGASL
ncbi:MAG: hypothetical protein ACJ79H_02925 [Myxococcales bacterium]